MVFGYEPETYLSMAVPEQAKITRKHIQRTVVFAVVLLAIAYGVYWVLTNNRDPDPFLPPFNSVGDVAAIQVAGDGSQAVIIKPDGTIIQSPDYTNGATDHDITWRPDGNRVFFDSDRYNQEPHLFRWNPDKQIVERRTIDRRTKGQLTFTAPGLDKPSKTALMISGGTVVEIDPNTGDTKQLLPPMKKDAAASSQTEEGGQQSQMAAEYQHLGHSFVRALWGYQKKVIAAVMRRDNGGEVLIIQDMIHPDTPPTPVATGEHVGLDVHKDGYFVFSVLGYQVPDWSKSETEKYTKNGKIIPPFKHMVGIVDPGQTSMRSIQFVGIVPNQGPYSNIAFGDPVISPDGEYLAMPVGTYKNQSFQPTALSLVPLVPGGFSKAVPLAGGAFTHPSWDPASQRIAVLAQRKDGGHDVISIGKGGVSDIINLTNGKGDYLECSFSPQAKAP